MELATAPILLFPLTFDLTTEFAELSVADMILSNRFFLSVLQLLYKYQ